MTAAHARIVEMWAQAAHATTVAHVPTSPHDHALLTIRAADLIAITDLAYRALPGTHFQRRDGLAWAGEFAPLAHIVMDVYDEQTPRTLTRQDARLLDTLLERYTAYLARFAQENC